MAFQGLHSQWEEPRTGSENALPFVPQPTPLDSASPSLCSDLGVAALSCCLWLTQLISFALARDLRTLVKV